MPYTIELEHIRFNMLQYFYIDKKKNILNQKEHLFFYEKYDIVQIY